MASAWTEPDAESRPAGGSRASGSQRRDALVVLAVAFAVRAAFIAWMPADAVSTDLSLNWTVVAHLLGQQQNPYNATPFLNWPPLWMQILFGLRLVSDGTGLPWFLTVRLFTAGLDLLALSTALLVFARGGRDVARALLYGWALNPAAVLIACQHCNFDSLMVLFCLLAIGNLIEHARSHAVVDWLLACLFVGLGVLTKTVPIVLLPLLIGAARGHDRKLSALGAALVLGPAALGMSVLYVLGPDAITANVLHYRSAAGWYGITGILFLIGARGLASTYAAAFPLMLLAAMTFVGVRAIRRGMARQVQVLGAAFLLLFVPTLGPGYGPQYVLWSLPFLCVLVPTESGARKTVLIVQLVVTACTLIVEYGLFPTHGALFLHLSPWPELVRLSASLSTQAGQTLTRLPLFLASATWLAVGARALREDDSSHQVGPLGD